MSPRHVPLPFPWGEVPAPVGPSTDGDSRRKGAPKPPLASNVTAGGRERPPVALRGGRGHRRPPPNAPTGAIFPLLRAPKCKFVIYKPQRVSQGAGEGSGSARLLAFSSCLMVSVCLSPQRLPFSFLHAWLSPKELPLTLNTCHRSKYGEAVLEPRCGRRDAGDRAPRYLGVTLLSVARFRRAPAGSGAPLRVSQKEMPWVASVFFAARFIFSGGAETEPAALPALPFPGSPSHRRLSRWEVGGEG